VAFLMAKMKKAVKQAKAAPVMGDMSGNKKLNQAVKQVRAMAKKKGKC
jgi:hypothetical protein